MGVFEPNFVQSVLRKHRWSAYGAIEAAAKDITTRSEKQSLTMAIQMAVGLGKGRRDELGE